ncbi:MAG: GPW/gp25 family protein [Candidatus Zixiibacteriota bacterium]|nr:MAG: GPW/gp25 family protein [candidate division Zixibacteria bacterium]
MEYLALPFVLRKGYLDRADLRESITQSVGLLLSTRLNTMPFNRNYGCDIWDKEFSDFHATNKADVRASLRNAIDKYERRLMNVSVSFVGADDTAAHTLGIVVKVRGNYLDGSKEKAFEASYGLG